jgi:D-amino peptidase
MKLLIAADMEGITGVVNWNHVDPHHSEYQRFRRLMPADVNAAIRGAAAAGVEEIIVTDGHHNGDNILIEELDARARLNSGLAGPFSMVEGIDQGIDAVFFIGYHARMGTRNAVLDHTWSSRHVQNVWLNRRITGEIGLNASVCVAFGAVVLLVSGDQSATEEAAEWIPGIEKVIVKRATSRSSAEVLAPIATQAMISKAAEQAVHRFLSGKAEPLHTPSPVNVTVEFFHSQMADQASLLPGSQRLDARRIEMQLLDMPSAYRAFRSAVQMAGQ